MAARRSSADALERFLFETDLWLAGLQGIAGVDEAGRGPLAGPVVAAAVVLPPAWYTVGMPAALRGLNDSKQLPAEEREDFHRELVSRAEVRYGIAVVDPGDIDRINILQATYRAMVEAVRQLQPPPEHILVDGLPVPALTWPHTAIVGGDGLSYSIAAASVLAKVTRDRLMVEYDRVHPEYGFARHKGYPTPEHLDALRRHGPCPIHRRSFEPVRALQLELF